MSIEQVTVPAYHALREAAVRLQSARSDLVVQLPFKTTVREVLKIVNEAIEGVDPTVLVFQPMRAGIGEKLRELALQSAAFDYDSARKGQRILSTVDLGKDRLPRPSPSIAAALKEMALKENVKPTLRQDPYVLVMEPTLYEETLALVPCNLALFAVNGTNEDVDVRLYGQEALWDTGANYSLITEDLLPKDFLEYLEKPIHGPYRCARGTRVSCKLKLGFSNQALQIELIMLVTKRENIPNHRSGIILGQHFCINRLIYMSSPAAILNAKGENIPDNLWGRIDVTDYVNLDGDVVKV